MDEVWNPVVVGQDPTQGLRQGVEEFGAAFAAKCEPDGKVICTAPADTEETPEVGVDGEDFEGAGDIGF